METHTPLRHPSAKQSTGRFAGQKVAAKKKLIKFSAENSDSESG